MISSFAPGLAVRILLSVAGNVIPIAGWALVGLWDGYAVRQMTEQAVSYEAPLIWAVLFVVDYYISNDASLYKTSIISVWTALGIIITDLLSPDHWHDTTSQRRKGRSRRHSSGGVPATISPLSQPIVPSSSRRRRGEVTLNSQRPIIEDQTAVTFAALQSGTSLSSDLSSLVDSDTETSTPHVWDNILVAGSSSTRPNTSDETGHRATRHLSNSTTPAGHSSDPYDTQLPSPPDTFSQRTPNHVIDASESRLIAGGAIPGAFAVRRSSRSPASRNSTPPLMVPSVHLDHSLSQGTLLSSDSEHSIPPDLLSPLDINETGATTQAEAFKIIPPRRMTPMPMTAEVEEPVASSSCQVEAQAENDQARLTSSEEDSSSEVANDPESLVRAANMYRRRAKDHENEVRKLKKDMKAAGGSGKKKQSIVLRNTLESSEEQVIKYHAKADECFFRVDNPTPSSTINFTHIMGPNMAIRELKKHIARFLASDEISTTVQLGKTRSHEVRQAILQYLSQEHIPYTSQDPSVIVVAQLSD